MIPERPESVQRLGLSMSLRRNLSLAAAIILSPFLFLHILEGNTAESVIISLLLVVLLTSAWSLHYRRRSVMQGGLTLTMAVVAVLWTTWTKGPIGIYWAYPVVLLFHIILPRRQALMGNLVFAAALVPVAWWAVGAPHAIRVISTMFLASWFSYIFATRHERQQERLQYLVRVDPLTGSYNRRHFEDFIEESVSNKQRYERPISLLLFDIDYFKTVNDKHGHKIGDEVLCWVVEAVTHRIRRADCLFRYGGDEFVILMPQTDLQHAGQVADNLRTMIGSDGTPFDFKLSISIGVSELCCNESADSWVKRADHALYEAKDGGRNRVTMSPSTIAVNQ